jgi:hypothetical protein
MPRLLFFVLFLHSSLFAAQPNVVWIIADDMSPDIGAYGLRAGEDAASRPPSGGGATLHAGLLDGTGVQFLALGFHPRLLSNDDRPASA